MRVTAVPLLGLVLVLGTTAGCGGGGNDGTGVASARKPAAGSSASPSGSARSQKDGLLAYARCMRANGIPKFPDPTFDGDGGVSLDMPTGTDPTVAGAAQQKCASFLPNSGDVTKADPEVTKQLLAYARCMRANGIPKFPDPGSDGHLQLNGDALGISTDDPKYKAADRTCSHLMPQPAAGGPATQTHGAGDGA
ncbi:MAG: hypothetical protein FWE15_14895 [Actinomycetia bacterium]|nr:hypothetical protein [Actinomycetes bacterium]